MLTRKRPTSTDDVSASDLLAGYTATRVPAGARGTGLPGPRTSGLAKDVEDRNEIEAEAEVVVQAPAVEEPSTVVRVMFPVEERRGDPRLQATLAVSASYPGSEVDLEGLTVDVSRSGMCLRMPEPPVVTHMDVLVGSDDEVSLLWVQVLNDRPAPDGDVFWHVRVAAADEAWPALLDRIRGSRPDVASWASRHADRQRRTSA